MESSFKSSVRHLLQRDNFIYWLLGVNLLVRALIAVFTTLGNDEVYYTTYALHPALSYFDHPPFVGYLIWLSTFGLSVFHSEFFVRLGSLLLGTFNLYLAYRIGIQLKDKLTGIIATVFLAASFYSSIIVGTFILPDTPQSSFWLLSILLFVQFINSGNKNYRLLLLFGVTTGLALLSKYHAVYLWLGAGLYFLFYDRKALLNIRLWISVLISGLMFLPVIIWNLTSEYSGLAYHLSRVGNSAFRPSLHYFFPEFFGEIFYNNPFNFYVIAMSLILVFKLRKTYLNDPKIGFLLSTSLPLILTVLLMSFFNRTLAHWSGPSYFALILLATYVLQTKDPDFKKSILIRTMIYAQAFFFLVVAVALFQVQTGILMGNTKLPDNKLGKDDFTIDLGVWHEIAAGIKSEINKEVAQNEMTPSHVILTHNWFPGSHLDYYYAMPNHTKLYILGQSTNQHNYMEINHERGEIPLGSNAYYVTTSHFFSAPKEELLNDFKTVVGPEIIPIYKNHKKRVNIFLWRLLDLQKKVDINPTDKEQSIKMK